MAFFDPIFVFNKKYKKNYVFFVNWIRFYIGLLEGLAKNVSRFKQESSFNN